MQYALWKIWFLYSVQCLSDSFLLLPVLLFFLFYWWIGFQVINISSFIYPSSLQTSRLSSSSSIMNKFATITHIQVNLIFHFCLREKFVNNMVRQYLTYKKKETIDCFLKLLHFCHQNQCMSDNSIASTPWLELGILNRFCLIYTVFWVAIVLHTSFNLHFPDDKDKCLLWA